MTFRSAPRWPRRPKPNPTAENRRLGEELWKRIDGRIPRDEVVSEEDRRIGEELWARIDGRYAREEQEDEWADIVAGVREAHRRLLGMAR